MKLLWVVMLANTLLFLSAREAQSGQSGFETGNSLLYKCSTLQSDDTYYAEINICLGYVAGVADTSSCASTVNGFAWNMPNHVTIGQLSKIVTKWLELHPEFLHNSANSLIGRALQDAFPCP